jgi:hypothetical protein
MSILKGENHDRIRVRCFGLSRIHCADHSDRFRYSLFAAPEEEPMIARNLKWIIFGAGCIVGFAMTLAINLVAKVAAGATALFAVGFLVGRFWPKRQETPRIDFTKWRTAWPKDTACWWQF